MSAGSAVSDLLAEIVRSTRQQLGAAACSIALLDGDELVFRVADGAGAEQIEGMRLPVGRGLAGYVVASEQAIAVDVRSDQRFDVQTAESTGYVPTTILAVPIEGDEGPIGVLEVLDRQPGVHDMEVAAAAARQVALAVQLVRSSAEVDVVLADERLADLVSLVRRFCDAEERELSLAVALLGAVLESRR